MKNANIVPRFTKKASCGEAFFILVVLFTPRLRQAFPSHNYLRRL